MRFGLFGSAEAGGNGGRGFHNKRRVYKMTRRGERALSDHRALWQRFADVIGGLFGEKAHAPARTHR